MQGSKLHFSKNCLLATFNHKMVALKQTNKKEITSEGAYFMLQYIFLVSQTTWLQHFHFPTDLKIVKNINGQESENRETLMSGSRNDLLKGCWDLVTNHVTIQFWSITIIAIDLQLLDFGCKASCKLEIPLLKTFGIKMLMKTYLCFCCFENVSSQLILYRALFLKGNHQISASLPLSG